MALALPPNRRPGPREEAVGLALFALAGLTGWLALVIEASRLGR